MRFITIWLILALPAQGALRRFGPFEGTSLFKVPVSLDWKKADKGSVVIFVSSVCPCSDSHQPKIKKFATEFPAFKFYLVHSNREESADEVSAYFVNLTTPSIPVLGDSNQNLANAFGALRTPHVFVISPQGDELYRGAIDNSHIAANATKEYLHAALTEIQQGKVVSQPETRPLGCAIQR